MDRVERYIFGQAGPSIYTYLATHTVQQFLDEVKKNAGKINPKQQSLVELFKNNKTDDWQYKRDSALMLERWKAIYDREAELSKRERELKELLASLRFDDSEDTNASSQTI